jgi:hypothetical protein
MQLNSYRNTRRVWQPNASASSDDLQFPCEFQQGNWLHRLQDLGHISLCKPRYRLSKRRWLLTESQPGSTQNASLLCYSNNHLYWVLKEMQAMFPIFFNFNKLGYLFISKPKGVHILILRASHHSWRRGNSPVMSHCRPCVSVFSFWIKRLSYRPL